MLAKNPDLLDMGGTPPGDAALILKQARELGFTGLIMAPTIGGSWPLMIEIAGAESAEGLIFNGSDYASPVLPQGARDLFEDFIRRFDPEGGVMGYVTELGYVAASFLVQGALAADSIDTDDIVAAIDADGYTFERFGFTGVEPVGQETFGIRHQVPLVLAYSEIQDGQMVMLDADLLSPP
jgi:branched-chain amino acid transport system substrate-binding protein